MAPVLVTAQSARCEEAERLVCEASALWGELGVETMVVQGNNRVDTIRQIMKESPTYKYKSYVQSADVFVELWHDHEHGKIFAFSHHSDTPSHYLRRDSASLSRLSWSPETKEPENKALNLRGTFSPHSFSELPLLCGVVTAVQ